MLGALGAGAVVLFPSIFLLFRIFKTKSSPPAKAP
jgi:hypothetical protein